ncbi:MAG TPA: MoaD/ThiS family protein [Anaerolineales bacterium]|nr:MoaD/ThiS family protein [Anaerolineales bacterium]
MKTIRLFATLRDVTGVKELTIPFTDGQTVREMLTTVVQAQPALGEKIFDASGEMTGLVHVLVHGRNIMWLNGLDTVVRESDLIVLLPPSAGG